MSFDVGQSVGPYRIVEHLGHGGLATVFKAYHAALDRYVALKVLHPGLGTDKSFVARFQREARVVARLEHPHIVPIYDFAEDVGQPYLVMKFIPGKTLKARLDEGPLGADETTAIVEAVGSALAYAHSAGILHRDIKPSNVLLADDGQVYLADFGLARIAASASTLSSDSIMGTPQYISPEQAKGEKDLTAGTDIYSFGVMLYEMQVGRVPFNADTPFSIIHDHIYSPLPLPRSINASVPEAVQRVLLKALAKNPADRYLSVRDLVKDFGLATKEALQPAAAVPLRRRGARPRSDAAATLVVAAEVSPATSTSDASTPNPKQAGRKRRLLMAGGGVTGICAILLCLVVAQRNSGTPTGVATSSASASSPTPAIPTAFVEPGATLPPAVWRALTSLQREPTNPDLIIDLSLAYWVAGMPGRSIAELERATQVAGQDNSAFLLRAGAEFTAAEAWFPAATVYGLALRALETQGKDAAAAREAYHQSLYMASQAPDFLSMLPEEPLMELDKSMGMVALARNLFHRGDTPAARRQLTQVLHLEPNFPEALLLQAEMDRAEGNVSGANAGLSRLVGDASISKWIRVFAQQLIARNN